MEEKKADNRKMIKRLYSALQIGMTGGLIILYSREYYIGYGIRLIALCILTAALYGCSKRNREWKKAFGYALAGMVIAAVAGAIESIVVFYDWQGAETMVIVSVEAILFLGILNQVKKGLEIAFYKSSMLYELEKRLEAAGIFLAGAALGNVCFIRYHYSEIIVVLCFFSTVCMALFVIELQRSKCLVNGEQSIRVMEEQKSKKTLVYILLILFFFSAAGVTGLTRRLTVKTIAKKGVLLLAQEDETYRNTMRKAGFPEEILKWLPSEEVFRYADIYRTKNIRKVVEDRDGLNVWMVASYFKKETKQQDIVRILYCISFKNGPRASYADGVSFQSSVDDWNEEDGYAVYKDEGGQKAYKMKAESSSFGYCLYGSNLPRYQYLVSKKGKECCFILAVNYKLGEEAAAQEFAVEYFHMTGFCGNPWWLDAEYQRNKFRFFLQ